jgi:beta-phosphoglucomutase-like phosphatase (HAD superfamily)
LHHVMFDIDGTLVTTYDLDSVCYIDAVKEVTGICIDSDWAKYRHVTDAGILEEIIEENGLGNRQDVHKKVKAVFIEKLKKSIASQPVQEVPGAATFLGRLNAMNDITVSLATGGWYETAALKLTSAGIDCSEFPMASANDSSCRAEIMKLAVSRVANAKNSLCTYFGDGIWDKRACEELGFNFVLVGSRFEHKSNISDFVTVDEAMSFFRL